MSEADSRTHKLCPEVKAGQIQGQHLKEVMATLSSHEGRFSRSVDFDEILRIRVVACLDIIGATGLVARFPSRHTTLSCFPESVRNARAEWVKEVEDIVAKHKDHPVSMDEAPVLGPIPRDHFTFVVAFFPFSEGESRPIERIDHAALVYENGLSNLDFLMASHGRTSLRLLFQVLSYRVRRFAPFAGKISQRYWDDSGGAVSRNNRLTPPWRQGQSVRTATLSFDLRKSTFSMENAEPVQFAKWIDELVQVLTRISHLHGGVFDKFTGDGALIHFLHRECKELYGGGGDADVVAAVTCGMEIQEFVRKHMKRLRPHLRRDSELLGGAIGIDVGNAFWSIDHRGNPIVVGPVVVEACRLGDKAEAGKIRLGNMAYHKLPDAMWDDLEKVRFESKEYDEKMKLIAWEFLRRPHGLRFRLKEVGAICREVYAESRNPD